MTFTPEQNKALQAKLEPSHIASRSQSGRELSYIEGWWAISEANRIFGFDAWSSETVDIRCVAERERKVGSAGRDGWGVSYIAKVRVSVDGVTREGVGSGHGIDVDLGLAHESAIKEAETDARKRALMTFGNPFGLALYDKTQANVASAAPARKSSAQAKRDGDHEKVMTDINGCNLAGLLEWETHFDAWTAHLPIGWLEPLHDRIELRREELLKPAADMDTAYRATVGPGEGRRAAQEAAPVPA